MYPFNYVSSEQNRVCFTDYGSLNGKWCGSRGGVQAIEGGYFNSGAFFKSGNGVRRNLGNFELDDFTIESWVNSLNPGLIFNNSEFNYGLTDKFYFNFNDNGATGDWVGTGWNHNALSVQRGLIRKLEILFKTLGDMKRG